PVILISSLAQSSCETALEGLRLGAVDVLAKPNGPYSVGELRASVVSRIHAAARARVCRPLAPAGPPPPAFPRSARRQDGLVAIGASTGGVEAITTVLTALPEDSPPILIT